MFSEHHHAALSATLRQQWQRLAGGLEHATLAEQAAGPAGEALWEEFRTAMNTHNLPAGQVRVVLDGVRVPPYHYSEGRHLKVGHSGVVDRAVLNRYLEQGATVMLDDAQMAIPAVDRLCAELTADSGVPVSGTVFASPPHAEGFALHQDNEDVIVVQLAGAKAWTVFPPLHRDKSSMLKRSECGEPLIDTQLRAGDILLMPKGSPHKTASNSAAGSAHLTLGFYPVTVRELMVRLVEHSGDARLDEPVPADLHDVAKLVTTWLTETLDNGPDALTPLVAALRTRLRGDTVDFRLPAAGAPTEGGSYRLLTRISEATRLFLAARLARTHDEQLTTLVAALRDKEPGDTFTYREFATAEDRIVAQEVLHEMLRLRFIAHVPAPERAA